MKKFAVLGVLVLVVAAGFGVYFLLSNLNSLVASAIEKHGSEVTETTVSVAGVDISLREGKGSISDLRVASPKGYKAKDVFTLGDITIDLDVSSVRKDPIVIDAIRIRQPVISAEVLKDGSSNVEELRKRVQDYAGDSAGKGKDSEKRIRIKQFVFEKGRVDVDLTALGSEKRTLTLPEIRLNDVGGKDGAPPDQIAKIILTTVAKKTASEIASSEVKGLIDKNLNSVSDKAKGLLKKLGN